MKRRSVLVDTGFLVALGIESDPRHKPAREFLRDFSGTLLIPAPVVTETCYFLSTTNKVRLLDWLGMPQRKVVGVPPSAYPAIGSILAEYDNLDPDFTDAAIVWAARETSCSALLTVDHRDFGIYRIDKTRRFEVVAWFGGKPR